MSAVRAVLVLGVLAFAAAAVLALVSRAPEGVRRAEADPRAADPALGDDFTDAQIARHGLYRRSGYIAAGLSLLLDVAALVVLARGPARRAVDALEGLPGGWAPRALLLGAAAALVLALVTLPLGFVRGYAVEKAWGLSTQTAAGWFGDWARGAAVAAVIGAVASVAFFGVVRWQPRAWWVVGWATFSLLTLLLAFLWPVVIAPLFFKFAPLQDASLAPRLARLATEAGVEVDEVRVADASRRTTAENAYVAGLGSSKQLVVYDTLLRGPEAETEFVVAHELGHERENHVLKGVAVASLGLAAGFGALALLARSDGLWAWAGASGIGDLRALPILLLFATVAGVIALPAQNLVSRRFEAHADEIAIELTGDPRTAVGVFRRLALSNIADLRPPSPLVTLLFSHPPIPERIRSALARTGAAP